MTRGRDKFSKAKKLINLMVCFYTLFPGKMREKLLVHYRNMTGNKGFVFRYVLLKSLCKKVGDNVSVHPNVYIFNMKDLEIGNNVSIHPMTYIEAWGGVKIGNDVSIAHNSSIISFEHNVSRMDLPIKDQGVTPLPICIEDDVWIGAKVVVLGGVTIKKGSVIGAASVVTKTTEENGIYVGIPAKKIRSRG